MCIRDRARALLSAASYFSFFAVMVTLVPGVSEPTDPNVDAAAVDVVGEGQSVSARLAQRSDRIASSFRLVCDADHTQPSRATVRHRPVDRISDGQAEQGTS